MEPSGSFREYGFISEQAGEPHYLSIGDEPGTPRWRRDLDREALLNRIGACCYKSRFGRVHDLAGYDLLGSLSGLGEGLRPTTSSRPDRRQLVMLPDLECDNENVRLLNFACPPIDVERISAYRYIYGWSNEVYHEYRSPKVGGFLDLRNLLRVFYEDGKIELEEALEVFGISRSRYGAINIANLYRAIKERLDRYFPDLDYRRIYSAGGIADQLRQQMGWRSPKRSEALDGQAMAAFYGGLVFAPGRGIYNDATTLDFKSAYTTTHTLMQLHNLQNAAEIVGRDGTAEVRQLARSITLEDALQPDLWPQMTGVVYLAPQGAVLPVRLNVRDDPMATTYAVASCERQMVYTIPDYLHAVLRAKENGQPVPNIISATIWEPAGLQALQGIPCCCDDGRLAQAMDALAAGEDDVLIKGLAKNLRSADAYGNTVRTLYLPGLAQRKRRIYYGRERGSSLTMAPEWMDPRSVPQIGTLVSAGCRFLVGLAELLVLRNGAQVLSSSTDSLVVTGDTTPLRAAFKAIAELKVEATGSVIILGRGKHAYFQIDAASGKPTFTTIKRTGTGSVHPPAEDWLETLYTYYLSDEGVCSFDEPEWWNRPVTYRNTPGWSSEPQLYQQRNSILGFKKWDEYAEEYCSDRTQQEHLEPMTISQIMGIGKDSKSVPPQELQIVSPNRAHSPRQLQVTCPNGHPKTPGNRTNQGRCRSCINTNKRLYRAKKSATIKDA